MKYRTIQNAFFFVLLALTTLAFFGLIRGFMVPIFWAVVLAILFYPLHQRLLRALGDRASLAAALSVVAIVLLVILPLALIGVAVSREAAALYERIATGEIDLQEPVRAAERMLPTVTSYLEQFGVDLSRLREGLSGAAVTASQFLASRALAIGQSALQFSILFFLMLYVLFFFLRDGDDLLATFVWALPLGDDRERRLIAKFAEVSRATIKGTLVVGVVQGTLGGLAFWALGIEAAVFWGVIMTVLSLLPAVGSALVWGPAAVMLLASGSVIKGLILLVFGTLIIGLVDNVLRPLLVGRDTKMPDFLILLSTLGGLAVFGLSGFVIGPIIAAFFLVVWQMFGEEYADKDNAEAVLEAARHPETAPPPRKEPTLES